MPSIPQQIAIAALAFFLLMFLFLLAWRILAMLRLLPCLLVFAASKLLFPEWSSAHPVLCWVIVGSVGVLGLLTLLLPKISEWRYYRFMAQRSIAEISSAADLGVPLKELETRAVNGTSLSQQRKSQAHK